MALSKHLTNEILAKCTEYSNDMELFLEELVKIPSVMDKPEKNMPYGKNSAKVLEVFLEKAKEMGFNVRNIDNYAGVIETGTGMPELGILCHLDVVDPGTGWTYPPFELTRKNGVLYGRGTTDDKGPAVSALYGLKAAKELVPLKKNIRLIVGCNEENGSDDLEYYQTKEKLPEKLFTPDGQYPIINIEKGMIRGKFTKKISGKYIKKIHGGDTINAVPSKAYAVLSHECSEKLRIDSNFKTVISENEIKINSSGISAHASTPEGGKNALTSLIQLLGNVPGDESAKIFKNLSEIFPPDETNGKHAGVKCSDEKSGALTLVLSVMEYDGEFLEGIFDVRFPVSFTSAQINEKLNETLEKIGFEYECILASEPHYVDENSEFIQSLLSVYENMTGEKGKCIAIGGGTYVHNTPGGVAFGAEFPGKEYNIHCADEFTVLEEMILNAQMTAGAAIEICS
ncbi:Sapep family Mn(2+)-dependent dipeptidase [Porcipelethomonas sp.]|uniref:Sapep family Mn(2+)-dependent dipeptidase n=1 Tax=Porcipelethomonas sp. TaxID=2981675 RepID=UPI003EF6D53E